MGSALWELVDLDILSLVMADTVRIFLVVSLVGDQLRILWDITRCLPKDIVRSVSAHARLKPLANAFSRSRVYTIALFNIRHTMASL